MTPEAQRIAIAEARGWRRKDESYPYEASRNGICRRIVWYDPNGHPQPLGDDAIPDYPNDLNAMHEALNAFGNMAPLTRHQWWQRYSGQLSVVLGLPFDFMPQFSTDDWIKLHNATAAQRAEAFLRTIGKWTDDATKP